MRSILATIVLFSAVLAFSSSALGQSAAAVAPPGIVVSATPPAAPAAPVAPAAAVAPAVARREDTEVAPAAGSDLNLIQRAVARISGIPTDSALGQQATALAAENTSLRQQVATLTTERDTARTERDASRAAHTADLAALQAAIDAPASAAATPAGQQVAAAVSAQVGAHLRSMSHPAANLPAQTAANDPAAVRSDSLRDAFAAETDPVKKSALFQQIKKADTAAKSRAN